MDDLSIINDVIAQVKESVSRPGLTNCIMTVNEIEMKIQSGLFSVVSEEPLLLIERHEGYYQLYFFLKDKGVIKGAEACCLSLSSYHPLYADITQKEEFVFAGSILEQLSLYPYRTYIRKSVVNKNLKIRKLADTVFADSDDVEAIHTMLIQQFDLMADRVPTLQELDIMIQKKGVLKISINNAIAGVLLYEDTGKRSYARALCVASEYQNSFVGYSLMADYFTRHDENKTKVFNLWVDKDNIGVKKLHDGFGYREDGLKNYVFRRM